jgi:DNA invertase Pin-like site-specific DNA recombinase
LGTGRGLSQRAIRAEKRSGTTTEAREPTRTMLEFLHVGDVLMVTRIDRLDLQDIVRAVPKGEIRRLMELERLVAVGARLSTAK